MSLEQLEARLKALEQERASVTQQYNELVGAKRELEFVQSQMVPGLDHERLDERRHKMDEAIGQFQARLLQIQGGLKETTYWIHQTPAGQDPKSAVEQYRARHDADGPVGELDALSYASAPAPVESPNGVAALVGG